MKKLYKIGLPIVAVLGVLAGVFVPCEDGETVLSMFLLGVVLLVRGIRGIRGRW